MRKVALHNLGCKVNAYETEAMRQALEENGYDIVSFNEKADIYIINTCTVTNIADRKEAIKTAIDNLNAGDVLIVAGKGHETGQYVQGKILPFSDHDAIVEACKK